MDRPKKSFVPIQIKLTRQHINQLLEQYHSQILEASKDTIAHISINQLDKTCQFNVSTSGIIKGDFVLSCHPVYDQALAQFQLLQPQLHVAQGNLLAKSAGWMAQKLLLQRLTDLLTSKLNEAITEMIAQISNRDNALDMPDEFALHYKIQQGKIVHLQLAKDVLILELELSGDLSIHSSDLNMDKIK